MITLEQRVFQPGTLTPMHFGPTSRYHGIATATWDAPDGRVFAYVRRRFVPHPERFALLQEHVVGEGERLDHIAARYLGDPEQFWRICDANRTLRPEEATDTVARRLRITLPLGLQGGPHAEP